MEDVKKKQSKKQSKKTSSTSSVKKSKVTKKKVAELSNEELLEQILNKKKTKKTSTKKEGTAVKKISTTSKSTKKTKQFNQLENDFIYDQIKSSKKKTKKVTKVKKEEEKKEVTVVEPEEIKQEVKEEIVTEKEYDTYNSLEESVKRKKDTEKDDFKEFVTEIENEKLLKQIKDALARDEVEYVQPGYKVDNKEAIEAIDNEISERLKNKIVDKKKTSKVNYKLIAFLLFILVGGFVIFFVSKGIIEEREYIKEQERIKEEERKRIEEEQRLKGLYDDCLVRELDDNDTSEEIESYISELNKYVSKNYEMSIMYEDLTYGFSYSYNGSKNYYAASTIKSLGAIYVYEKASKGEIDLDDTMKYSSKYRRGASKGMKNHKYGENIKLRDLVKYSVIYSDNTAHNMIVSYVGVNKLREYGKSLGADLTHLNGDLFGYIDVSDANIYMKKLYDVINNTGDYGKELEKYFLEAEQNSLAIDDLGIKAAHKYGEYEYVYHDIGIVYSDHPYVIAVLTHEGRDDYDSIIKGINSKVYELHNMYYSNRESYCNSLVYGK